MTQPTNSYMYLKAGAIPRSVLAHVQQDHLQHLILPLHEFEHFATDPDSFPLLTKGPEPHRITLPVAGTASAAELRKEADHYADVAAALNRTADSLRAMAADRDAA